MALASTFRRAGALLVVVLGISLFPDADSWAKDFRPFWDFRQWVWAARSDRPQLYQDYIQKFREHHVTILLLNNPQSLPPFTREREFLGEAGRRGLKVWLRTNRVTPKGGIPGEPNSTLDFALNAKIQKQVLEYLLALAALSEEYPAVSGLIIGGEEWVGARIDKHALARHQKVVAREMGFNPTRPLTAGQKIRYFDWLQEVQNRWYAKIWDILKVSYPHLELFIYLSEAAVCGGRWSKFSRAAYWDIYDLIVTRNRAFSVLLGSLTIEDPLQHYQTAAFGT